MRGLSQHRPPVQRLAHQPRLPLTSEGSEDEGEFVSSFEKNR